MSNFDFSNPGNTPTPVDDFVAQVAGSVLRHGATYVAGVLAAAGCIQPDQQTQTIAILASIGLWAASQAWSIVAKRAKH